MEMKMTEESNENQKVPYKSMTYPVDEWGRLGGMFSLADVPVCKFVRFQDLTEEEQQKIARMHA